MHFDLIEKIFISFYILWVFINTFFWVAMWQEKEYRLDRFLVFFRENLKAKQILFSPLNILKTLAIIFYLISIITNLFNIPFFYIFYFIYTIQFLIILKNIYSRKIKKPVFTLKAFLIYSLSYLSALILILNPLTDRWFWYLVVDKLVFLIVAFYIFLLVFPTEIIEGIIISTASRKIKKRRDILIIGVSGSYGKTSTKEYIAQVLNKKYNLVKTPGSNNTPIGIARTILKNITQKTEIFVVEMGAYKIGEIEEICKIVTPKISITTGISDQHLSLYGNIENVINSENELIESLSKNSLSLFNGNSLYMEKLIKKCKGEKIAYETKHNPNIKKIKIISAHNIKVFDKKTVFDVKYKNKKYAFKTNLLGYHIVENLLPAIYLGFIKDLNYKEISNVISSLKNPAHTLKTLKINKNSIFIDDTFNSSPESVFSASEYVKIYKAKKIIILSPLVELGSNAKRRHEEIGEKLANVFDEIYLNNKNYFKEILKGINKSKNTPLIEVLDYKEIYRRINKQGEKTVVLFEGKDARIVLNKFL